MFDEEYQKLKAFTRIINNCEIVLEPKDDNIDVVIEDLTTLQEYHYCITPADLVKNKVLAEFFDKPVELLSSFQQMFQKGLNKIIIKEEGLFSLRFDLSYGDKKKIEFLECKAERKELSSKDKLIKKWQRKFIVKEKENQALKNRVKEYENRGNRWSYTMKYKSFKLLEDNIIQDRNMNEFKLALVEKVLPKNRIIKWKLKKTKQSLSSSAVRVCLKSVVLKKQYSINEDEQLQKPGHGCYMNSWSKFVISHNDANFNNKQISTVEFPGENQVIIMQFNPMRDTLTFTNESEGTDYTMPVPKIEGDDYHPCIAGRTKEKGNFQWQLLQIQE